MYGNIEGLSYPKSFDQRFSLSCNRRLLGNNLVRLFYNCKGTQSWFKTSIAVCIYCLVMISIELSETTHFEHWCGRNSNPVAMLPHAAVVFRMRPFNSYIILQTGIPASRPFSGRQSSAPPNTQPPVKLR